MKLAIIGSRTIESIDLSMYITETPTVIISGGAIGVDSIAAKYAKEHNIELNEILPDYSKYGKGALFIRNREIVKCCDKLIAFWDGKSKGTMYTVNEAKKQNKEVTIIEV